MKACRAKVFLRFCDNGMLNQGAKALERIRGDRDALQAIVTDCHEQAYQRLLIFVKKSFTSNVYGMAPRPDGRYTG